MTTTRREPMGFSQIKDVSGVAVVQVEGQLIVGNRQELKELVQAALRLCVRRSPAPDGSAATVVTLRLPSDVACIEEAVELVTRHCLAGHDTSKKTRFRLQVVLSEALSNAIVRGNQEERGKWVDVRAELLPDTIRVSVTDQGTGFDPSSVPEPISPDQIDEANG